MPQSPDHGRADTPVKLGAHVVELALASNGQAPAWIHLLPSGTFTLRDGRGPYRLDDAPAVVAASRAGSLSGRMPIDRDHALDLMAPHGMPAPAAGWIEEVEARADGIWARATWTERAALQIAALEYRYVSPVFEHTSAGEVVRVLRAALTNNPAIPNLTALASAAAQQELDMDLAPLRTALGAAIDADAGALIATAAATRHAIASVATAVGLAADAKPADVVAKVAAALKANPNPARFVPLEVVDGLQTELAALRTSAAAERATRAVDAAIGAGKLQPCLRDWGLALATDNPAAFAAWEAATPVLASSQRVAGGTPPTNQTRSPVEIAAAANALRAASTREGRELGHVEAVHRVLATNR